MENPLKNNFHGLKLTVNLMRLLKHHEIKLQQLKLLETCGHSLAEYAETKRQPEIIKTSPTTLSLKSIGNIKIKWVKNTGNSSNSNLIAFVHVLLHRTYSVRIQQNLLALIKSAFYNPQLDLTTLKSQQVAPLTNSQMKKLMVQFFYLLSFSFFDDKIEAKLSKYPIIMNIFVIFLRKILINLNLEDAQDLNRDLQSNKIYQLLSLFFKLNLQVHDNCFIFPQMRMIVMYSQPTEYHLGIYTSGGTPSIKIIQMEKLSIGTIDHSPKSKQSLDSPFKTQKMAFFPKKSTKNNQQQILKDYIKTFESLKELNQSQIKKAKSLKEIANRKYSNSQQGSLNIKQASGTCNCQVKKQSIMTIMSNIYELNIKFIQKNPHDSNPACYISSKGLNCQLFERKQNEDHILKTQFVYKKRFQTEQLHIPVVSSNVHQKKVITVTPNRSNQPNLDSLHHPISQYIQKQMSFNPIKPNHFQDKKLPSFLVKPLNPSYSFSQKNQWLPINSFEKNRNSTFSLVPIERRL